MSEKPIVRLAALKNAEQFREHLQALKLDIPCDTEIQSGAESPLLWPAGSRRHQNRESDCDQSDGGLGRNA